MKLATIGFAATILYCLSSTSRAGEATAPVTDRFPGPAWEHVAPEAAGWSAETLKRAEEWSHRIGSHAGHGDRRLRA
jgi:hypothetical protein